MEGGGRQILNEEEERTMSNLRLKNSLLYQEEASKLF